MCTGPGAVQQRDGRFVVTVKARHVNKRILHPKDAKLKPGAASRNLWREYMVWFKSDTGKLMYLLANRVNGRLVATSVPGAEFVCNNSEWRVNRTRDRFVYRVPKACLFLAKATTVRAQVLNQILRPMNDWTAQSVTFDRTRWTPPINVAPGS